MGKPNKLQRLMDITNQKKEQNQEPVIKSVKKQPKESGKTTTRQGRSKNEAAKKSGSTDSILEGIKGNKDRKEYDQFRMRASTLEKYRKMAERENVTYPGQIIHKVLDDFISRYEQENNINL